MITYSSNNREKQIELYHENNATQTVLTWLAAWMGEPQTEHDMPHKHSLSHLVRDAIEPGCDFLEEHCGDFVDRCVSCRYRGKDLGLLRRLNDLDRKCRDL